MIYIYYIIIYTCATLTAISISLEMKPQLKDVVMKLTSEATFIRILPLSIDDFEGDVLVRRTRVESQDCKVLIIGAGRLKIKIGI